MRTADEDTDGTATSGTRVVNLSLLVVGYCHPLLGDDGVCGDLRGGRGGARAHAVSLRLLVGLLKGILVGHNGHVNQDRARKRLAAVGVEYRGMRDDLDKVRAQLVPAIEAAIETGMRQVEIVELTGLTREYIRRIRVDLERRTGRKYTLR